MPPTCATTDASDLSPRIRQPSMASHSMLLCSRRFSAYGRLVSVCTAEQGKEGTGGTIVRPTVFPASSPTPSLEMPSPRGGWFTPPPMTPGQGLATLKSPGWIRSSPPVHAGPLSRDRTPAARDSLPHVSRHSRQGCSHLTIGHLSIR